MNSKWKLGLDIVLVRLRFIFVFIAVGLVVGNWTRIMNVVDKLTPRSGVQASSDIEYFCPMDPGVLREHPGNCPICGMPLSKRKKGEVQKPPEGVMHRVQLSPYRIQQAAIATEEVGYRLLVRELRTVGTLVPDERRIYDVTARFPGRIDKYYKNFIGQEIRAGEPYAAIYSPELLTTQEDLLRALKTSSDPTSQRLVEAAHKRLKLWGITDDQIAKLVRTGEASAAVDIASPYSGVITSRAGHLGHWLEMGQDVYEVTDLSVLWMQAEIYEDDLGLVKEGQGVVATSVAYPGRSFPGTVVFISPSVEKDTRTVKVRVEIDNPKLELKPGMYATASIKIPIGTMKEVFYGC